LRLAHTIQHYWPFVAGGENYCKAISEGLASEHEVRLYTTDVISTYPLVYSDKMVEVKNGVRINRIPSLRVLAGIYGRKNLAGGSSVIFRTLSSMDISLSWPPMLLARGISSSIPHRFLWLAKQLKEADLIVSFNMITGMTSLAHLASRLNKEPMVIFPFYHVGLSTFERPSLFKILRDATLMICSTDFERQALINRGLDPRRLKVVNEGIREPLVERSAVAAMEKIFDRREDQLILMYVGRRDYDKGYPHVLSAVARLVKSGISIKLVACGWQGETGANRADYLFLSKQNALVDLGVVDERTKVAAMSLCDAVVLPSRAETYPLAFVEAWFLGKPVIGARIGSVSSMVKEGVHGLLVEFGDIAGLAAAIRFLYENPEKRIGMGRSAQVRARKELTAEKTITKVKIILEELKEGQQIG
jgi:glycosyltransferase involved in cell wall biosynthesis